MIYWFTGQPSSGKTTLANLLKEYLMEERRKTVGKTLFMVDGDDVRELFSNKDYTINGRIINVSTAQKISHYLHNQGQDVIVSLVSPYIDQREEFKGVMGKNMVEIYVHTTENRERNHFHVLGYQPPINNYIDINTTYDTPKESIKKIIKQL